MSEFDALVAKARETNDNTDINNMWEAVFGLEEWIFIAQGEGDETTPLVGMIEEKPMLMAFTDEARAKEFGVANNLQGEDGLVGMLGVPVDMAVKVGETLAQHGVFGILFNQGENNFFAPLEQLPQMFDFFVGLPDETDDPQV